MARQGAWERAGIKVLSIGSKYRVVIQSILDVLGYGATDFDAREAAHAAELVQASGNAAGSTVNGPSGSLTARKKR